MVSLHFQLKEIYFEMLNLLGFRHSYFDILKPSIAFQTELHQSKQNGIKSKSILLLDIVICFKLIEFQHIETTQV